ncbi:MAG: lysostaphin resistance A-like protein [Planctomycetota bacterium]
MSVSMRVAAVLFAGLLGLAWGLTSFAGGGTEGPPAPLPAPPQAAPGQEAPASATETATGKGTEAKDAEEGGLTADDLEKALAGDPVTAVLLIALRFGTALLGAFFLVMAYTRWSRRRAGLLPDGAPWVGAPPGPTRPFGLSGALGVFFTFVGALFLVQFAGVAYRRAWADSLIFNYLAVLLAAGPVAAFVLLRRHALRAGTAKEAPGRTLWRGFSTFCVGNALAIPAALLGGIILSALGHELSLYGVVSRATDQAHPSYLWWTAVFAIFVAPVTEETLFRGLLYPAVRQAAGGGRKGYWVGAFVVSLAWASSHAHLPSFLPLLALGLVLVTVLELTDSLATVILGHAFFNAASLIPLLAARLQGTL